MKARFPRVAWRAFGRNEQPELAGMPATGRPHPPGSLFSVRQDRKEQVIRNLLARGVRRAQLPPQGVWPRRGVERRAANAFQQAISAKEKRGTWQTWRQCQSKASIRVSWR